MTSQTEGALANEVGLTILTLMDTFAYSFKVCVCVCVCVCYYRLVCLILSLIIARKLMCTFNETCITVGLENISLQRECKLLVNCYMYF